MLCNASYFAAFAFAAAGADMQSECPVLQIQAWAYQQKL